MPHRIKESHNEELQILSWKLKIKFTENIAFHKIQQAKLRQRYVSWIHQIVLRLPKAPVLNSSVLKIYDITIFLSNSTNPVRIWQAPLAAGTPPVKYERGIEK